MSQPDAPTSPLTENEKLAFIQHDLFTLLKSVPAGAAGKWGKMNVQQMIEHLADFFDVSFEKIKFDIVTPEEHLPKFKAFLLSDKQFRENTKAPTSVLSEEPLPLKYKSIPEAIDHLHRSVENFIEYFKDNPDKQTIHPVFGSLNFHEWIVLHHKHVSHHLRQFDLC